MVKQTKIQFTKKTKPGRKFNVDQTKTYHLAAAEFISSNGLALSFFEKPATQSFLRSILSIIGENIETTESLCPSYYQINQVMELQHVELSNLLRHCGNDLVRDGKLSVVLDDWHCTIGSAELENDYRAIMLSYS